MFCVFIGRFEAVSGMQSCKPCLCLSTAVFVFRRHCINLYNVSIFYQQMLWEYKNNMTKGERYEPAAATVCKSEIGKVSIELYKSNKTD